MTVSSNFYNRTHYFAVILVAVSGLCDLLDLLHSKFLSYFSFGNDPDFSIAGSPPQLWRSFFIIACFLLLSFQARKIKNVTVARILPIALLLPALLLNLLLSWFFYSPPYILYILSENTVEATLFAKIVVMALLTWLSLFLIVTLVVYQIWVSAKFLFVNNRNSEV